MLGLNILGVYNEIVIFKGRHFFISLVSLVFSVSVFARPLCDQLLLLVENRTKALSSKLGFRSDEQLISEMVMAIVRAGKVMPHFSEPLPETAKSLMTNEKRNDIRIQLLPNFPRSLLLVMNSQEGTPWQGLSPHQRNLLALRLASVLNLGNYHYEIIHDRTYSAAFSPRQILSASSAGEKVGVCSDGNCALAGLLLEIGIPRKNLRLVVGVTARDDEASHIWVEYKEADDRPWKELDATPGRGSPISQNRRSFRHILYTLDPPGPSDDRQQIWIERK